MPLIVFKDSTTADAQDMNDNFNFIAAGSILPMTQTSEGKLVSVDSAYDYGASATTWQKLHTVKVDANSITSTKALWRLVSETTLTATAAGIEFTGLNGDAYEEMMLLGRVVTDSTSMTSDHVFFVTMNGVSTTSEYAVQRVSSFIRTVGSTKTETASNSTSAYGLELHVKKTGVQEHTATAQYMFKTNVFTKTGQNRVSTSRSMSGSATTALSSNAYGGIWFDTTATITSIKFEITSVSFQANTNIQLWSAI